MIDPQIRRMYLAAAGIAPAAVAVSLAWRDARITAGVAAGVAIGFAPFATWHLIVSWAGEKGARRRSLVLGLVLAKYAVLAGAMWVLFRNRWVNEYGFGAGLIAASMAVLGAVTARTTRKN